MTTTTRRIIGPMPVLTDAPFGTAAGGEDGHSLYVTLGSTVKYRRRRYLSPGLIPVRTRGKTDYTSWPKTLRRASAANPAASIDLDLTAEEDIAAAAKPATLSIDVRRYKQGIENQTSNYRTLRLDVDGSYAAASEILGTAIALNPVQQPAGIVTIRFVWQPNPNGTQPTLFRALRTAGPTSPADATLTHSNPDKLRVLIEIDTPALSDASDYTYTIRAENGAITADILTGLTITADATGPSAPTNATATPI